MIHNTATAHHLHIGNLILVLSIAIAAGVILVVGISAFIRWFIGWKLLVRKFPATDVHKSGTKYSTQNGFYYRGGSSMWLSYMFRVEVAQEGLLVTGYFARRLSILIPWSEIQNVEYVNMISAVRITLNYENERTLVFQVPKEALTVIRQNIPTEKIQKTDSLSQLIKKRLDHDV